MQDDKLINILENIAVLLEIKGESAFKSRAYQNAADIIKVEQLNTKKLAEEGKLSEINGFGNALVEKISDYYQNGKMAYYEKLINEIPLSLIDLTKIEGIGNKKAGRLYAELGIANIDELETAAKQGKIAEMKGFSQTAQENIINGIKDYHNTQKKIADKSFKNIF